MISGKSLNFRILNSIETAKDYRTFECAVNAFCTVKWACTKEYLNLECHIQIHILSVSSIASGTILRSIQALGSKAWLVKERHG